VASGGVPSFVSVSCFPRKRRVPRRGLSRHKQTIRRGESAVRDARRRLERLEHALPLPCWTSDIKRAKQRCLARLYLRIGEACGILDHPVVVKAQDTLMGDTDAQAEQDRDTLRRYAQQHPECLRQEPGARARLEATMARIRERLESGKGDAWATSDLSVAAGLDLCPTICRRLVRPPGGRGRPQWSRTRWSTRCR
jgi:hypothetical protein